MRALPLLMLSVIYTYFVIFPGFSEARPKSQECFNKDANMTKLAMRLLKRTHRRHFRSSAQPQELTPTETRPKIDCTKFKLDASSQQYDNRSVSPWRLSNNRDEDRYPVDIPVAECLCEGCIINGKENRSYNSAPVKYSKDVVKRVVCTNNESLYRLEVYSVTVPVACTCVIPNSLAT